MSLFEIIVAIEVGIIAVVQLLGAVPPPAVIFLGIILLIVGIFVARNILWPIGGILLLIGIVLLLFTPGYAYY